MPFEKLFFVVEITFNYFKLKIQNFVVLVSWIGFNCLKVAEPLGECSTTKSPGVPGAHLIDFGKMKG